VELPEAMRKEDDRIRPQKEAEVAQKAKRKASMKKKEKKCKDEKRFR
jgi:hypothetical protein